MSSRKNLIIIILLVVIAFLIGVQVSNKESSQQQSSVIESEKEKEEDVFDITDIGASDGGDAGLLEGATGKHTIRQGSDIYTFDSIYFTFTNLNDISGAPSSVNQAPQIQIRMYFENFKRNNFPIELASFNLGIYKGQCNDIRNLDYDPNLGKGIAFAQCLWDQQDVQLAIVEKGKTVSVYSRAVTDEFISQFNRILEIDVSQLVK